MIHSNVGNYSFPLLTEDTKKADYHKRFTQAILHRTVDDNYSTRYAIMAECYRFLEEGTTGELTSHLQQADDGTALPIPWLTLNSIKTKVNLLLGELEERGYNIKVRALNKEATSRKIEEKEKLRVRKRLKELTDYLEQQTGMPLENPDDYIPQTEAELNEYFDLTFKDKAEIIVETALKYLAKKNDWDEERKALFRDVLAVNRAFVREEIVRGIPRARRIDPLSFVHDPNCKKDDLSDSTYFGEVEYMSVAAAAERFNLSNDEIKEVYNSYQSYLGNADAKTTRPSELAYDFGCISGNRLKFFKEIDGELRILVMRACWLDYKDYKYKQETGLYGTEHLQEITEKVRKRDESKVKTQKFQIWRQATLVGGTILREWGECPNQARDLSDLEVTEAPYKCWIPNFAIGRGVSLVEDLAQLQLMKDISLYNMNHILATSTGGKALIYDLAMVPEGWTPEKVMKYLKVFKVAFVNSKESMTMPGNMNLFREIDMSLSTAIGQYLQIMAFYDAEMDKLSGVSPERQGMVQGASQGLGVTQSALLQSNLITAPLFKGFERFCSRVLNYQAKLVKIVFGKNPTIFAPIIGDAGVDFLREHVELDLDEFNAWVESLPPNFMDRQKLEQMIMLAVQSDPELLDSAIAIMMEPDTNVALRKFQRQRKLQKIFQAQQQQAQAERDAQLQQELAMLQAQTADKQIQGNLQNTELKNEGSLERTLAQGRVRLNEKKIDALSNAISNRDTK
jgi:hypothetical protein